MSSRPYRCSEGHTWHAKVPPTICPHCVKGKPCPGAIVEKKP